MSNSGSRKYYNDFKPTIDAMRQHDPSLREEDCLDFLAGQYVDEIVEFEKGHTNFSQEDIDWAGRKAAKGTYESPDEALQSLAEIRRTGGRSTYDEK